MSWPSGVGADDRGRVRLRNANGRDRNAGDDDRGHSTPDRMRPAGHTPAERRRCRQKEKEPHGLAHSREGHEAVGAPKAAVAGRATEHYGDEQSNSKGFHNITPVESVRERCNWTAARACSASAAWRAVSQSDTQECPSWRQPQLRSPRSFTVEAGSCGPEPAS